MAGHSRSKDGVAAARLCPAIHVCLAVVEKDVDARDKPGHDGSSTWAVNGTGFADLIRYRR
jgi:hypothetical protein